MSGYQAILRKSRELNQPTDYKDDLVKHDREALRGNKYPFIWAVREAGTWLAILRTESALATNLIHVAANPGAYPKHLFFFWDGKSLKQIQAGDVRGIADKELAKLPMWKVQYRRRVFRNRFGGRQESYELPPEFQFAKAATAELAEDVVVDRLAKDYLITDMTQYRRIEISIKGHEHEFATT